MYVSYEFVKGLIVLMVQTFSPSLVAVVLKYKRGVVKLWISTIYIIAYNIRNRLSYFVNGSQHIFRKRFMISVAFFKIRTVFYFSFHVFFAIVLTFRERRTSGRKNEQSGFIVRFYMHI